MSADEVPEDYDPEEEEPRPEPDYEAVQDADSARMLHRLKRAQDEYASKELDERADEKYLTSSELLSATELNDTTSVNYRMDEYLIPAQLARERDYAEDRHYDGDERTGPREYMITLHGIKWVESHPNSPLPTSEEVVQLRRDLDDEFDRIEGQVEDVEESLDQLNQQVEALSGKIGGVKSRGAERAERLDRVEARVGEIEGAGEIAEQVDQVEAAVGQLAGRLDEVEATVPDEDALNSRIESLQGNLNDLQREISDRQERMQRRDDAYDERLSSLENNQESMRSRMSSLKSQLDELRESDSSFLSRLIGR